MYCYCGLIIDSKSVDRAGRGDWVSGRAREVPSERHHGGGDVGGRGSGGQRPGQGRVSYSCEAGIWPNITDGAFQQVTSICVKLMVIYWKLTTGANVMSCMNFKEICEVNESSISAYDMITCIRNALQQKDPKILRCHFFTWNLSHGKIGRAVGIS